MKILVNGSMAYDLLLGADGSFLDSLDPEALDQLSVGYLVQHYRRHHGGTAANIAWNLAALGQQPLLVSSVGSDGGEYLELLRDRSIGTDNIEQVEDAMTATAIIATDAHEHQITFFHPGADAKGTFPDLADSRDDIVYATISPRDERLMMESVRFCKEYAVPYMFDPGQRMSSMSDDELLQGVQGSSVVIANAYEWELLRDRLNVTEENISRYTPMLIVTRGEQGALCFAEDGAHTFSACPPDQVVNPTGAGDALRAGVLTGLAHGWSVHDALRLGCSMGSFAVEDEGTLLDLLDVKAVWNRAEQTYGEPLPELCG